LNKEQSAIYKRLSAIRELYSEACAQGGALEAENIVNALSRKGGAQRHFPSSPPMNA